MRAIWDDRLAEVWASPGRAGAGVVVGAAAVLTARHLVAGALDRGKILSRVVKPGAATAEWVPMTVLAEAGDWDVAVLGVDYGSGGGSDDFGPEWLKPSSLPPVFVRLTASVERDCEAVGFPQSEVQYAPEGALVATVRQSEQVVGTLLPAGQAKRPVNPERPLPRRWMPLDVEESTPGTQAGWGGMSGAAVILGDGRLAGLIVAAESDHQQRRLYVVPLHDVLAVSDPIAGALAAVQGGPAIVEAREAPLYRDVLQDSCLAPEGMPILVREATYKAFGVKAAGLPGEPAFLEYVPRDADQKLRDGLQTAHAQGRMLLLVGGSAAGKSRSAAEAVRLYLPDHRLLAPQQTSLARIRELPVADFGPALAWLDDAERYEERAFRDTVEWLLRSGVVVVATIRGSELEKRMPKGDLRNPLGEALTDSELVVNVSWPTVWNEQERARVGEHVRYPPLLAWVAAGSSPSAWVVAGPALQNRLRSAEGDDERPVRFAVVRVVLDWYRTSISRSIPSAVMPGLLHAYLPRGAARGELEEALQWAFESVTGAGRLTSQSLLAKTSPLDGITVHDFIQDADAAVTDRVVPDVVWTAALDAATSDRARFNVGFAAAVQGNVGTALKAFIPLAVEGDDEAMYNLGVLFHDIDPGEARRWYEQAVAAGRPTAMWNLGLMLKDDNPRRARRLWEQAAEVGLAAAMTGLGVLLADSDPEQSRHWYEQAAEAGDADAMTALGALLADSDPEQSRHWYEQAAEVGDTVAMYNLGALFENSDPEQSRHWYEQAAEAGHANAMTTLGALLADSDPGQARRLWEQAAEAGNIEAAHNLGLMLADNDSEQARRWFEQAAEAGDTNDLYNLGVLLADSDPGRARRLWEQAAEAGDTDAMTRLGVFLAHTDPQQARHWYEQAAEAGDTVAMYNLGLLLKDRDLGQARRLWEQAAEAGLTGAMTTLGVLLADSDPGQSRRWYEQAAEAGDSRAMNGLGVLLADSDPQQAQHWYEKAAEAGNSDSMYNLGALLEVSDPGRAQHWYEKAAEAGDADAMYNLGLLLEDSDPGLARQWYEKAAEAGHVFSG